jgi:hypothetical protein
VQSVYGSTEGGVTSAIFDYDDSQGLDAPWKTSLDFDWMQFPHPVNVRFADQGDGTYELHFLVSPPDPVGNLGTDGVGVWDARRAIHISLGQKI